MVRRTPAVDLPAAGVRPPRRWTVVYFAFFACYLGGLVMWLALGLLPTVVFAVPALTAETTTLAAGTGPLAGLARSVLESRATLPDAGWVSVQYLFSVLNLALGCLITLWRPFGVVPRLLALAFIGTAATFNEASHVVFHLLEHAPLVSAVHFMFHIVSGVAYAWAVVLFPGDGQYRFRGVGRRRRVLVALGFVGTAVVVWICWRSSFISHPPFFVAFFGIVIPVLGIAAQTVRLSSGNQTPVSRQQSRLLRMALLPALGTAALWLAAHAVDSLGLATGDGAARFADVVQALFPAVFAVVPVMLFVAVLRYRLWDIELVVSRTLLYTLLVVCIAAVYAVALGVTGWLFQSRLWASLVALTVVALAVEPVRRRCGHLANRIVFGTTLTPRESMRALAERLTASTSTNELAELTSLVVAGTRASAAGLWLVSTDHLLGVAAAPDDSLIVGKQIELSSATFDDCCAALPGELCLPVRHDDRLLAVLALVLPPKVSLPMAETRLVRDLAGHAGLLVANATLTTELALEVERVTAQAAELLRSRQLVVAAQDAERRRLERDIHDGAQQELVATVIQLRMVARADSGHLADSMPRLVESTETARTTIEELCRGGGPMVLAKSGLPSALEAVAATARRTGLVVDVHCRVTDRAPADVETTLYFCCREALQNAVKHAHAQRIVIELVRAQGELVLRVSDDGHGFEASRAVPGSGLTNLLERTALLGGTAGVESSPGAGTSTTCRVPLPAVLIPTGPDS